MTLRVAPDLELPDDLVTKTVGILAQRRKGKTYTASVIAEEMVDAGFPFVVLDPTGAWWGMRASADGNKAGLPVTILGGHHGDVPLERTAGKVIAELVVDTPGWYVLDFSLFESKEADRQFATDFAERLYRRKGQEGGDTALHVFIDEADLFVPQQSPSGDKRMLGAFETLVRRGGIRGIGTTLISQRAAVINKNVLEMLDMLVVLRTVGPNDRKAIDDYVKAYATDEQRAEVLGSLASLDIGEAWIYEPGDDLLQRVHVRARRTFNSSATPKAGEKRVEPRRLADVDLDVLKDRMAATIEKADAADPKKLQARVRELERELAASAVKQEVQVEVQTVEVERLVPVIPEEARFLVGVFLETVHGAVLDAVAELKEGFEAVAPPEPTTAAAPATALLPPQPRSQKVSSPRSEPRPSSTTVSSSDVRLDTGQRKVLTVLVQHDGRTRQQLCALTGYTWSGGFRNILSSLRTADLITGGNQEIMRITDAGVAALGDDYEQLPTGHALFAWWLAKLDGGQRKVLAHLHDIYPAELAGPELAAATGYEWSGGFRNILSSLRTLELIVGKNTTGMRASDELMEAIR